MDDYIIVINVLRTPTTISTVSDILSLVHHHTNGMTSSSLC